MISNNNINIIFRNENSDRILIQISLDKTIGDLIREYFRRIGKSNLIIKKLKYIKIKFLYEGRNLNNYEEVNIKKYLNNYSEINVIHEYSNNNKKIEIIEERHDVLRTVNEMMTKLGSRIPYRYKDTEETIPDFFRELAIFGVKPIIL